MIGRVESLFAKITKIHKRNALEIILNKVSEKSQLAVLKKLVENNCTILDKAKDITIKWQLFRQSEIDQYKEAKHNLKINKKLPKIIKKCRSFFYTYTLRKNTDDFAKSLNNAEILGSGSFGIALKIKNHFQSPVVLKILFEGDIENEMQSLLKVSSLEIDAPAKAPTNRVKQFKKILTNNFQSIAPLRDADLKFFTNRNCIISKSLNGTNRFQEKDYSPTQKYLESIRCYLTKKGSKKAIVREEEKSLDKDQIAPMLYIYQRMYADGGIDLIDAGALANSLIDKKGQIKTLDFSSTTGLFKIQNKLFKEKPWRGALWQILAKDIMQCRSSYNSYRNAAINKFGASFYQQRLQHIKEALNELIKDGWAQQEEIEEALDYLINCFAQEVNVFAKEIQLDPAAKKKHFSLSPESHHYLINLKESLSKPAILV